MVLEAREPLASPPAVLTLDLLPPSRRFSVGPATNEELPYLTTMTARRIPGLQGTYPAVERVHRHSRSILAVRNGQELVGCFAALLLNRGGHEALLEGTLSFGEPSQSHLVRPGEKAAAIYVWAVCGLRMAMGASGNIVQWLRQSMCAEADLYARPFTPKGKRLMIRAGFQPLPGTGTISLWVCRRAT